MTGVEPDRRGTLRCSTVVTSGSRILLVHRTDGARDDWVLPGGTPKRGESLMSCARREVLEETGLRIMPNRIAFVLESIEPLVGAITVDVVFLSDPVISGQPRECEPGLVPAFVPLADLARLSIKPPIAGHLRNLLTSPVERTAAYLGNLWRPRTHPSTAKEPQP